MTPINAKRFGRMMGGHSDKQAMIERQAVLDGFHTPRIAVETLTTAESLRCEIWEPANGFSRISNVLRELGHDVFTSDVYRWHEGTESVRDFRECTVLPIYFRKDGCDIVTNPPFVLAQEFAETSLRLLHEGDKLCLLLRLQWLEGNKRGDFFQQSPPVRIHVYSFRIPRMHRFGYRGVKGGSTLAFAWFVWEKGYKGPTELRWIRKPE